MSAAVDRIVYTTPDGDLVTVDRTGAQRRRVTTGDRAFRFPAWSPDSTQIATVGGNRARAGVYVFDASRERPLAPTAENTLYESGQNAPIYVYWSPDSKHVSFIAAQMKEQSMGLHVAAASHAAMLKGDRPVLVALGRPCFWEWTPDARRILMHIGSVSGDEDTRLTLVDPFAPAGSGKAVTRPGLFQSPGFACRGDYRAFGRVNKRNELQLIVESIDGDELHAVRHEGVAAMSWSPAAAQLAYISPPEQMRTYYGPLRLIDAESGEVSVLSDEVVLAFFWSPDGRKIAYFTVAQAADAVQGLLPNAHAAARDGGSLHADAPLGETDNPESLAVSSLWLNLWVVDLDRDDDRLVLTFEPVDIFINQFLPFFDQYAKSHRIWSPDSNALVLPMMRAGDDGERAARIVVVSTDGDYPEPVSIGDGEMAAWSTR